MPRLEATSEEKLRIRLATNIIKNMGETGYSNKAVANYIGLKEETFYKKLRPGKNNRYDNCIFTSDQIAKIFRLLDFNKYEILESMSEVIK